MLLPQDGKEADRGVPGQGVLQTAIDGPHPEDEAPRSIDAHQQQWFCPYGTALLQHRGQWPLRQELHLLPQTAEALLLLTDLPTLRAAGWLKTGYTVCAEAPDAEVVATGQ